MKRFQFSFVPGLRLACAPSPCCPRTGSLRCRWSGSRWSSLSCCCCCCCCCCCFRGIKLIRARSAQEGIDKKKKKRGKLRSEQERESEEGARTAHTARGMPSRSPRMGAQEKKKQDGPVVRKMGGGVTEWAKSNMHMRGHLKVCKMYSVIGPYFGTGGSIM